MGKSAGKNVTASTTAPPSFQQPYIDSLLSESKKLYNSDGPSFFPGSTVANFTDAENLGGNVLNEAAVNTSKLWNENVPQAVSQGLNATDVANNQNVIGMADAATRPIIQQLNEQVLPNIRSGAVASGTLGGSRQGIAEAQGMERAARSAMDTRADVFGSAYGQGLSTMSNTLSQIPALTDAAYKPGAVISSIGEKQRQLDQAKINEDIARWDYGQNQPYQKLTEYGNVVSKPFGGQATSEVTATGGESSQTIGAILAGLGSLLSGYKALFP